jgi:hypothetical protein
VEQHVAGCADCRRFLDETRALDARVRDALALPTASFRKSAPARRYALAASIALAILLGAGLWVSRPPSALAVEVIEHVKEEGASWQARAAVAPADVIAVLQLAGVEFDATLSIVYAAPCTFRGRRISHLVVQTASGPMTVMLLAGQPVARRQDFSEDGYRGVLLPAGTGSVALLLRAGKVPETTATQIVSAVRFR